MGNACQPQTEESKRSAEIDRIILKNNRQFQQLIKLLLLGPGESGKSTIFKQMKILQLDGGFSPEEMNAYRNLVFRNCISEMKVLAGASNKLEIPLSTPQNQQYAQWLLEQVPQDGSVWTKDVASVIKTLWLDDGIKKVYARRGIDYHLNDTADYFFDNIDRFVAPDYKPTEADILRTRIRSTGIEEAEFKFADMTFKMMDVGGQRSERRKWIHCFENVITAVVFCASLSCYDQKIREDDTTNSMVETLQLFEEVSSSNYFKDVAMILLLNKLDLFTEKIKKVDLNVWDKTYTGGCDFDKASEFIKARFVERFPKPDKLFIHLTIAIDSKNIDLVFKAVRKLLIEGAVQDIGL